jgi:hypothetical protein
MAKIVQFTELSRISNKYYLQDNSVCIHTWYSQDERLFEI